MAAFLSTLSNLFTLLFVVTSMLSMGLALTIPQILEPLRNTRLIALALVANFVVVPAAGLVAMAMALPLAAEFGKHVRASATAQTASAEDASHAGLPRTSETPAMS